MCPIETVPVVIYFKSNALAHTFTLTQEMHFTLYSRTSLIRTS